MGDILRLLCHYHDQKGQLLNTNADTIAATLSQNLSQYFEVSLWYCFEKQGVLNNIDDDSSVIETITPSIYNLKAGYHSLRNDSKLTTV